MYKMNKEDEIKKELIDNFNKFIIEQQIEPFMVCRFIYSLLKERNCSYYPTFCSCKEYKIKDGCNDCD